MLIVYPLENWNTFTDVAKADVVLVEMGSGVLWNTKTTEEKEILLVKSSLVIKSLCNIKENTCLFSEAQLMLIQSDLENEGRFLSSIEKEQKYKKAKVGPLDVEYNILDLSVSDISKLPFLVRSILSNCLKGVSKMQVFKI